MKTPTTGNARLERKLHWKSLKGVSIAAGAGLAILGLVGVFSPPEAQAFSCAQSPVGTGCVSQRGAVGFNRNGVVAVGRYGNVYAYHRGSTCYWRNGHRICP
jgi:hypothetical protein